MTLLSKDTNESHCFLLTGLMTLSQSSYRECNLSIIRQRRWRSLGWPCHFPSEIIQEKVLELTLDCLIEKKQSLCSDSLIHLPSPHPSVYGDLDASVWTEKQILLDLPTLAKHWMTDSSPVTAGLLIPSCYHIFPWTFWLTSLSTLEHLPAQSLLPPTLLPPPLWAADYVDSRLERFLTSPMFMLLLLAPEFFAAPVYFRMDNTALWGRHGSFMFCPYLSCLSQLRYWLHVGSWSVFAYFIYIFVCLSVWCVCECSLTHTMVCMGQRTTFWKGLSSFTLFFEAGPLCFCLCTVASTQLVHPAGLWTPGRFSCLLPISL